MKLETFFENFDLLTDAPNAATKLKELVLQLAVRGKLADQDPDHPSASELVQEIETIQKRLIKDKKIKRIKTAGIDPDSTSFPFDAPTNWQWVRLGQIVQKLGAGSTPLGGKSVYVDEGIKFLRSQNVWNDGLRLDGVALIPPEIHQKMDGTFVEPGDILLNITGASIGRCAVVPDDFDDGNVSQHVAIVRLIDKELRHYLHLCLVSSLTQEYIMSVQVGISREGLSMARLKDFLMPIPPLAEQKRIVEACDRILTLCDKIDQHQQQRHEKLVKMNEVAIAKLLTAQTPDEFDTHWQRLWQNFDLLYSIPETIPKLRQAILQLAVQGKLVEQDPSDEPASEFLRKLQAEKKRLVKEKVIRNSKILPGLEKTELDYPAPIGWQWVRFGDTTICRDGERIPLSKDARSERQGEFDYYGASGVIDKIDDYLFDKPLLLIGEDGANLVNRSTPIAFIAFGKYWVNNHAHVLDNISFDCLRYLEIFINSINLMPYITGTAQPKMNQAKMNSIPVALPPLAEQKRIVAKVDRLMALCDAMEAKLTAARAQRETLMEAAARQVLAA